MVCLRSSKKYGCIITSLFRPPVRITFTAKVNCWRTCDLNTVLWCYELDAGTCECNCRTFMTCRYPCRHILLTYVKRPTLTAHHILRPCSRWKLNNTHNFHYNTTTSLPRRSEEYIRIQRSQKIHKQQIVEKYGEHFAMVVEKKVDNYHLKINN